MSGEEEQEREEIEAAWRNKANVLIGALCFESYRAANTTLGGKVRKRRVPYSVPELAKDLIECLNTNDEEQAKAIFLSEDCMRVLKEGKENGK